MAELRSARWFAGDDEAALQHRAALRSLDIEVVPGRPVIGISDTVSDLNPCNSSMAGQIEAAKAAVLEAGGTPVVFPSISLGEDLMKPTAMLYRNLLAIEIEEMVRAYPIDALIVTGSCDKTVPGALMGAISADVPTVMIIGGPKPTGVFRGERIGAGTGLWQMFDRHRSGELSDADWREFERCYACGLGSCNVMGTALTMAIVAETLGFALPGTAAVPAADPRSLAAAADAGRTAVRLALDPVRPRELVTPGSLAAAARAVAGAGGSTNAVIHLAAMAGRAGIRFGPDELAAAVADVRVVADIQPIGRGMAEDFDAAGGVPALLPRVGVGALPSVDIERRATVAAVAPAPGAVIGAPVGARFEGPAISVVRGSLAPDGAVIKTAAASPELLVHRGPALVFDGYEDLRARIDDPALPVTADTVLVLRGGGPVGGPGMPEWGMVPIPAKLLSQGVTDMVRVSDARMSGTSFGTVVLHVAPESAVGGPLALLRDGDQVVLDVPAGRLDLDVDEAEIARRRAAWAPPAAQLRGWVSLYQRHVTQAPEGCDLDFLQAFAPGTERFVEPTVGRS